MMCEKKMCNFHYHCKFRHSEPDVTCTSIRSPEGVSKISIPTPRNHFWELAREVTSLFWELFLADVSSKQETAFSYSALANFYTCIQGNPPAGGDLEALDRYFGDGKTQLQAFTYALANKV